VATHVSQDGVTGVVKRSGTSGLVRLVRSSPIFMPALALRRVIRLLRRQARQIRVARSIATFYADAEPSPPVTDALVTAADMAAADRAEW
jgi:hypothetical protein